MGGISTGEYARKKGAMYVRGGNHYQKRDCHSGRETRRDSVATRKEKCRAGSEVVGAYLHDALVEVFPGLLERDVPCTMDRHGWPVHESALAGWGRAPSCVGERAFRGGD